MHSSGATPPDDNGPFATVDQAVAALAPHLNELERLPSSACASLARREPGQRLLARADPLDYVLQSHLPRAGRKPGSSLRAARRGGATCEACGPFATMCKTCSPATSATNWSECAAAGRTSAHRAGIARFALRGSAGGSGCGAGSLPRRNSPGVVGPPLALRERPRRANRALELLPGEDGVENVTDG